MNSKQMTFRFDQDLIALVKEKAKGQNRSLNNFIEHLLYKEVGNIPNEETLAAIEEAENGELEKMGDIDKFFDELETELNEG